VVFACPAQRPSTGNSSPLFDLFGDDGRPPLFQRAERAIEESCRVIAETGESLMRPRIAIVSAKRTDLSTCAEHARSGRILRSTAGWVREAPDDS
jgi:hypothetical protein